MKYLKSLPIKVLTAFLIVALLYLSLPQVIKAAPAYVQGKSNSAQDNTPTVTYDTDPVSGNCLTIAMTINGNNTVSAVPTGFTLAVGGTDSDGVQTKLYYKQSDGSETGAISFTLSASTQWWALGAMEHSGLTCTLITNGTAGQQQNGVSSPTSGNITGSATTGDLIVEAVGKGSFNAAATVGSGFTGPVLDPASTVRYGTAFGAVGMVGYRTDASGNVAGTFSLVDTTNSYPVVAVFRADIAISQVAYRFRNDDGSESGATWAAAENTGITFPLATNLRLRAQASTTGDIPSSLYQLEFKKSTDSVYKRVGTTTSGITFVATSTASVGSTTVSPAYPAGLNASDLLVLCIESKPGTATIVNPSGWNLLVNPVGGQGANGVDTGTTTTKMFTKQSTGLETGTFNVSITTGNSSIAQMAAYRKGTGQNWATSTVGATDNAGNDNWSAASTTSLSLQAGDVVATCSGINTDASGFTSPALAVSGITFVSEQKTASSSTNTGNDTSLVMTAHTVSGGTDGGGPTLTMTASGQAASRPAGGTAFLKMRQTDDPIILMTSANITNTGEDTTAQLSVPGGKSFTAGRINDTENPADAVDIASNRYSEFEWNLYATTTASNGDIYQFRITKTGTIFDNYNVTPQWTIGALAAAGATPYMIFMPGMVFMPGMKF